MLSEEERYVSLTATVQLIFDNKTSFSRIENTTKTAYRFPLQKSDEILDIQLNRKEKSLKKGKKRRLSMANQSGVTGVSWSDKCNKWLAQKYFEKKQWSLGYYNTVEAAAQAVQVFNRLTRGPGRTMSGAKALELIRKFKQYSGEIYDKKIY